MRIIGLTGSIACGKSTVSAYLISLGFPVIDGDRISHDLTSAGSPVLNRIREAFGPSFFYDDGTLNRRRLGKLVFRDAQARSVLDELMAPYLMNETLRRIDEMSSSGKALGFLDMPLLFEKGYNKLCDSVWTVWLPEKLQIARLMERDGFSEDEALNRIHAVLSSDEKASLSDRVIDNSGSVNHTYMIVSQFLSEELSHDGKRDACLPPDRSIQRPAAAGADLPYEKPAPGEAPQIMERPDSVARKKKVRKAQWCTPVWLKSALIVTVFLLLAGTTAYFLMNAYLRNCQDMHCEEQNRIDSQYPLVYRDLIEQYAAEFNLSPAFVSSIIRNESSFQPKAESGVGARGLMQLMPETAEWIAGKLRINGYAFERMYDPESNIRFGCWYLNYLSGLYMGDPVAVTAAYHAGQGQVKVWLSDPLLSENGYTLALGSLPDGPTKNYAGKVLRDYGIYQKKYFTVDQLPPDSVSAVILSGGLVVGNRRQYNNSNSILKNADDTAF